MTGNDICEVTSYSTVADRLDRAFFLNCAVEVLSNVVANTYKEKLKDLTGRDADDIQLMINACAYEANLEISTVMELL